MYPIIIKYLRRCPTLKNFTKKYSENLYSFLAIDLLWGELLHEKHLLFANSIRMLIFLTKIPEFLADSPRSSIENRFAQGT